MLSPLHRYSQCMKKPVMYPGCAMYPDVPNNGHKNNTPQPLPRVNSYVPTGYVYVCPIPPKLEQVNKTANDQTYSIDPEPLLHSPLAPDLNEAVGPHQVVQIDLSTNQ